MDRLRQGLALALRQLRIERSLSQEKLAAVAGIHRSYVFKLERGEVNPSLDVVTSLAGALGISTSELVQLAEKALVE
jgi:transcriptional regulator with XRE-family HTH domain